MGGQPFSRIRGSFSVSVWAWVSVCFAGDVVLLVVPALSHGGCGLHFLGIATRGGGPF